MLLTFSNVDDGLLVVGFELVGKKNKGEIVGDITDISDGVALGGVRILVCKDIGLAIKESVGLVDGIKLGNKVGGILDGISVGYQSYCHFTW